MSTMSSPTDTRHVSLLWAGTERADEIAALHAALFEEAWSAEAVRDLLDHPAATSLVALAGSPLKLEGFILAQLAGDEAEILSLGVAEPWQRRGIGKRLVEGLARAVKRADAGTLHLEVAADNAAAIGLYKGVGFVEAGRRKAYYQRKGAPAQDALRLVLALTRD